MLLNILPEVAIAAINFESQKKGNNPKTSPMGKVKTGVLSATIIMSLLPGINVATPLLSLLTLFTQVVTAKDYYNIDKLKDKEKENNTTIESEENIPFEDLLLTEPVIEQTKKQAPAISKKYKVSPETRQQIIELLKLKRELIAPQKEKRKKLVLPTQKDK